VLALLHVVHVFGVVAELGHTLSAPDGLPIRWSTRAARVLAGVGGV
jgi:hypothetical protein